MIRAYPNVASLYPGEVLRLHVSTDSPRYKVQVFRQGKVPEHMKDFDESWKEGVNSADHDHYADFQWAGQDFLIPSGWPSGAYIAVLYEGDLQGNVSRAPEIKPFSPAAQALFVVKNPGPETRQVLYKVSLATFHAYNSAGGGSLYTGDLYMNKISKVTIHRPGGGTGGLPWDSDVVDVYDPSSPRQTFAHWDYPFICWLEENGYAVDCCTDMDLEEDPGLLERYNLLLSVGHDEYWSENMRANVEEFISNGGNVAFFSANTAWWHINFTDPFTGKDGKVHYSSFSRDMQWHEFNPANPENRLTGVSYRNGGGWWNGHREQVGYTVQNASHWIFDGTGLSDGTGFGKEESLVGYECDGAYFDPARSPFAPDGSDRTSLDFAILGTGVIHGWEDLPPRENGGEHAATMGIYSRNGIVFTAGTVDWTRVLAGGNAHVEQITHNVLQRLSRCRGTRILGPITDVLGEHIAIEGRTVKCKVSTLSLDARHAYRWKVHGEVADVIPSGPYVQFRIVKARHPVTVTAEVYDGPALVRFGTLTFVPISEAGYAKHQEIVGLG